MRPEGGKVLANAFCSPGSLTVPNANFDITVSEETKKLLDFFQKRSLVSGYLRHVLDADLFDPRQVTEPDWYGPLNKHLALVKASGQRWFDTTSVSMTGLVQNYIDFPNSYDGQMHQLRSLMNDLIARSGGAERTVGDIVAIFDKLIIDAGAQKKRSATCDAELRSLLRDLSSAIEQLSSGAASVNAAIQVDQQAVRDISDHIASLQAQLQTDIKAAIAADSGTLAALVVLVIGIVVAVAAPGTAAIISAVVAGVGLLGTVVGTVITSTNIVDDQNAILDKIHDLSSENQQVVVLNALAQTVSQLVDTYTDPEFDAADLVDTWTGLVIDLQQVRNLIVAGHGEPTEMAAVLADIQDFQRTLHGLRDYATELQTAALTVDTLPVQTLTPLAA
jgi:hypothetical protein